MHSSPDRDCLDIFRRQAGIITKQQAEAAGLSSRQIKRRRETGEWYLVRRGVYAHSLFDRSDLMAMFATTIGGNGWVSHRSAARLHGLEPELRGPTEVTIRAHGHVRFDDLLVHESKQPDSAGLTIIQGLDVSGVERTIMDVAAVVKADWIVLAMIDSARRKNLTTVRQLDACLAVHARRGRDGTVRFRRVLEKVDAQTPPAIGHLSRKVAALTAAHGLPYPAFELQVFDSDGHFIAQVDLSYLTNLHTLIDGFRYHGAIREQTNRDRYQRERLRQEDHVILEFTADQISRDPGFVADATRRAFREAQRRGGRPLIGALPPFLRCA